MHAYLILRIVNYLASNWHQELEFTLHSKLLAPSELNALVLQSFCPSHSACPIPGKERRRSKSNKSLANFSNYEHEHIDQMVLKTFACRLKISHGYNFLLTQLSSSFACTIPLSTAIRVWDGLPSPNLAMHAWGKQISHIILQVYRPGSLCTIETVHNIGRQSPMQSGVCLRPRLRTTKCSRSPIVLQKRKLECMRWWVQICIRSKSTTRPTRPPLKKTKQKKLEVHSSIVSLGHPCACPVAWCCCKVWNDGFQPLSSWKFPWENSRRTASVWSLCHLNAWFS